VDSIQKRHISPWLTAMALASACGLVAWSGPGQCTTCRDGKVYGDDGKIIPGLGCSQGPIKTPQTPPVPPPNEYLPSTPLPQPQIPGPMPAPQIPSPHQPPLPMPQQPPVSGPTPAPQVPSPHQPAPYDPYQYPPAPPPKQPAPCFIATAAYGDPLAQDVTVLREFRDRYLVTNPVGERFVALYYRFSPPLADYIGKHEWAKGVTRAGLRPLVYTVQHPLHALLLFVVVAAVPIVWRLRSRRLPLGPRAGTPSV
jgi:hypothetical protein